jgi:predicted molibdopterin-dependent oxidoreductase YjgC
MLTGNIGKEGTGVNPLRGQNNVQGACDLGALPDVYTGYQPVTDLKIKKKFEEAWTVQLNDEIGLTALEMINAANEGELKGLYIMGENPLLSDPNTNKVRESLEKLEFLVVQDIFLSETAQMADVVLPGTSSFEKEGTFTNTERRIQKIESCINPRANSRPDWKIISQLSKKMGYDMNYNSPAEIMDEIAELTPIYKGVHYNRLRRDGLQWPCTDRKHPGTPYLHKDKFSRGKGLFNPVKFKPPAEEPDNNYPFLLSTGRILQHFHTGVISRRSKTLDTLVPEGYVEIHPEDAEELRIKENDNVQIESRRGKIVTKAKITDRVVKGSVFTPFHFKEAAANILTNDAMDPVAKIPEYKVAAVRISRVT